MAKYTRFIKNDQWKLLEPLLPKAKRSRKGGRPAIDNRQVLEGILWVLRPGEKRGAAVGPTKRGKGTKWMVVVDSQGIPLGSTLASASPAEVTLAEETLEAVKVTR